MGLDRSRSFRISLQPQRRGDDAIVRKWGGSLRNCFYFLYLCILKKGKKCQSSNLEQLHVKVDTYFFAISLTNLACRVVSAIFFPLNSAGRKLQERVVLMLHLVWRWCSGKQFLWEGWHLWRDVADSQHQYLLGCACFKQLDFRSLQKLQKGVGSWETAVQLMVS